jgi:phosphoglycolate phosphatase-like HAD superfamily hydrolase
MPKMIILDSDGTLHDSMCRAYRGVKSVFEACNLKAPLYDELCEHLDYPFTRFFRDRGVHLSEDNIRSVYLRGLGHNIDPLFPDTICVLKLLQSTYKIRMAVVSARTCSDLSNFYKEHKISGFFESVEGCHFHKSQAIMNLCIRSQIDPGEIWYVGDMACDMRHAVIAGVKAVGITRRYNTEHILRKHGAQHCFQDLYGLINAL